MRGVLVHKACREGFSVRHLRLPGFFRELAIAKGDGRYHKLLSEFAKNDLLAVAGFRWTSWPNSPEHAAIIGLS